MALYEYDCPGCGRLFEKRMPMAEADRATCPHCGNSHPKRRLSRINLKGQAASGGSSTVSFAPGGT
mgnify:CR=1 FL=1